MDEKHIEWRSTSASLDEKHIEGRSTSARLDGNMVPKRAEEDQFRSQRRIFSLRTLPLSPAISICLLLSALPLFKPPSLSLSLPAPLRWRSPPPFSLLPLSLRPLPSSSSLLLTIAPLSSSASTRTTLSLFSHFLSHLESRRSPSPSPRSSKLRRRISTSPRRSPASTPSDRSSGRRKALTRRSVPSIPTLGLGIS